MRRTSRDVVFENARFTVYRDGLAAPDGLWIHDYLVVAPLNSGDNLVTGVAVLAFHEGRIGLLRVYRHPIEGDSWEIPRGFIDQGETPGLAAARELEEETGLRCDTASIQSLGLVTPDAGIFAARVELFLAADCRVDRLFTPNEAGHRALLFMTPDEVSGMIDRSEIQDPYTIVAFAKWRARGGRG